MDLHLNRALVCQANYLKDDYLYGDSWQKKGQTSQNSEVHLKEKVI